jgi:predicted chitinase
VSDLTLDPDALRHVCPNLSPESAATIAAGLAQAFQRYKINTERRAAMAVAQWAHESDRFKTGTEYASGDAYEGRRDLGNSRPGDGRRFKGRGRIMITGRTNYTEIGKALGLDCVNHPEMLGKSPYSELASGHWWEAHHCNEFCDRGDFEGLTRRINGGLNGFDDRKALYARAREVSAGLVPRDPWSVLMPQEREQMETLAKERRIAKRNGGWDKVDPSHKAHAVEAKSWLTERRNRIKHEAGTDPKGWAKANRRARYDLLKSATD